MRCARWPKTTYGKLPANPDVAPRARTSAGAAAARRAPRRPQGPARRQCLVAPRLRGAELRNGQAGRSRSPRPPHARSSPTARPAASTRNSSSREKSPRPPAAGYRARASTAARSTFYAIAAEGLDLDKVEASLDSVIAEVARQRRHGGGAEARQVELHRRLHLRERQPDDARPPLRLVPGDRPHHRTDRRLARRHLQGHRWTTSRRSPPATWTSAASVTGQLIPTEPDTARVQRTAAKSRS